MTKAVMISIQPKWVEKILKGEKTIEVRKTAPLSLIEESVVLDYKYGEVYYDTPFKVYIYMTQGKLKDLGSYSDWIYENRQKVVAEFTCDKVSIVLNKHRDYELFLGGCCLNNEEIDNYSKGKDLYGWHISDLKIYDKPREIGEFRKACIQGSIRNRHCMACQYGAVAYIKDRIVQMTCNNFVTRPPQSWCYVEEGNK